MNRYFLIGDYTSKEVILTNKEDYVEVAIPFRDNDNAFRYGIDHSLKILRDNGIYPTEDGIDILCLAGLVYLADTRISRGLHSQIVGQEKSPLRYLFIILKSGSHLKNCL